MPFTGSGGRFWRGGGGEFGFAAGAVAVAQVLALGHGGEGGGGAQAAVAHIVEQGGVRFGMGENFTVAIDMGSSEEAGKPLYIGLGYLY